MPFRVILVVFVILFLPIFSMAQDGSWRIVRRVIGNEKFQLDSLSIYPNTFTVKNGNIPLSENDYIIDYFKGTFQLKKQISDTLLFSFQVFPFQLSQDMRNRDESIIYNQQKGELQSTKGKSGKELNYLLQASSVFLNKQAATFFFDWLIF
jgi:hypothetical protein